MISKRKKESRIKKRNPMQKHKDETPDEGDAAKKATKRKELT